MLKYNPLLRSFSLQLIFFSQKLFYGNYATLDSHTNTVISHTFAYSSRWHWKQWQGLLNKHNPMIYQTISLALLVLFFATKDNLLCAHINSDLFTGEYNMLLSHEKIPVFWGETTPSISFHPFKTTIQLPAYHGG